MGSTTTAMTSLVFLATLALVSCSPVEVVSSDLKAASPLTNCGCQCSSLTFVDSAGHVQGNCKSVDSTGARWCYIDPSYGTSCQDLTPSARFPANPWSYEACATPTIGSYECPAAVAPATVVVSAPLTTTSMCLQLLSPPPSRSLLPMCPSSTTTTTTSTSLPLSSSPTIPTPTLTGTRSPRAPIWPPSPRRQTPPSRRLTLPSQPSRELSIFVLWGHYYQIKTRQYH